MTDRNGKKQEWKSILKLPFVIYNELEMSLKAIWEDVSLWLPEERKRNEFGTMKQLVSKHHAMFGDLQKLKNPRVRVVSSWASRVHQKPVD